MKEKVFFQKIKKQILLSQKISQNFCKKNQEIVKDFRKSEKIGFCGLGGSAIGGDILKALSQKIIFVFRDVDFESNFFENLFVVSYSGNTLETLNCFKKAKKLKKKIISITSGGKLAKISKNLILLPQKELPREALFYLTVPLLVIVGIYKKKWRIFEKELQRESKKIAQKILKEKNVLFLGSPKYECLLKRFSCQLAENSKIFAPFYLIPEFFHNLIECKNLPKIILIKGKEKKLIEKEMEILKKFFPVLTISLKGKNEQERIFNGIILADLVSLHLAKSLKINFQKTEKIKKFKKILLSGSN